MIGIGLFKRRKRTQEIRADTPDTSILSLDGLISPGTQITREQAMEIPTVAACIGKIADEVAKLPVKLYRRDGDKVAELTGDSRIKLLNGETGDTLSTVDMWRAAIADYYLGRGAWIFVDSDGIRARGLHYVDSSGIGFRANADPIFKAFRVEVGGREYYDFQFIRLLRRTRDGWTNIPLQSDSNTALAAAYNALKLENQMNSNGGCQPGFLKSKSRLARESIDLIRENYRTMYSNSNSDSKIVVLNEGIDFQPASSTAAELQLNENKRANSMEICKLFGFPHTVIDGGASEDDNKKFIAAVVALLSQIETALDSVLLLESEKEQGYYWAFDTKELTRGSLKERYEAYEIAVRNNILQVDEIRREEDYEPMGFNFVKLGLSDVLLNPETMEVFTPNTGQSKNLLTGEERAQELRGWITKNGRHILIGDDGGSGGGKSAKGVDKFGKGGIIKENSDTKPITEITDSAIGRVPNVKISGYTDEQCAEIQKQHKELLEYARTNNGGNEVAFVLDGNLQNRKEFKGSDDKLDFGSSLYGKDLTVMHNHPRNSSYSFVDVVQFVGNEKIKTLTIVKNNGSVETLTKLKAYDKLSFLRTLQKAENKILKSTEKGGYRDNEYRKFVRKFLEKQQDGGVFEWTK